MSHVQWGGGCNPKLLANWKNRSWCVQGFCYKYPTVSDDRILKKQSVGSYVSDDGILKKQSDESYVSDDRFLKKQSNES